MLLNLSNKTVEFHKHHIMRAFNLQSNADLVLFAVKQGLVSIKPLKCPGVIMLGTPQRGDPANGASLALCEPGCEVRPSLYRSPRGSTRPFPSKVTLPLEYSHDSKNLETETLSGSPSSFLLLHPLTCFCAIYAIGSCLFPAWVPLLRRSRGPKQPCNFVSQSLLFRGREFVQTRPLPTSLVG